MSEPSLPYELQLAAAGITPDKPLHAALLTAHNAAEAARKAVNGAHVLAPDDARALRNDVRASTATAVRAALDGMIRAHLLRTGLAGAGIVLAAALLAGAGGYALGRDGRARVADVCQGSAVREADGGTYCAFWIAPPMKVSSRR